MFYVVKINGRKVNVAFRTIEGRFLVRDVSSSGKDYICPLLLYSSTFGPDEPTRTQVDKILRNDTDAKWSDAARSLECCSCGERLHARLPYRNLLLDWTEHKIKCARLRSSLLNEPKQEDVDVALTDAEPAASSKPEKRGRPRSGTSPRPDMRVDPKAMTPTQKERIRILTEFRDAGEISISNSSVFCKPCNKDVKLSRGLCYRSYVVHTMSPYHKKNGGIPLVVEKDSNGIKHLVETTANASQGQRRSTRNRGAASKARSIPATSTAKSSDHPSVSPTPSQSTTPSPPASVVATRALSDDDTSGSTRTQKANPSDHTMQSSPGSGALRTIPLVFEVKVPEGEHRPSRLDFHGSVTF